MPIAPGRRRRWRKVVRLRATCPTDDEVNGDLANDGGLRHSYWVVLTPTEACGLDTLAVLDQIKGAFGRR